jgi:uncharacterized protein YbjT (DUF2867 family)
MRRVLLTGATGHVGGRLLARFERERRPVRCLTRSPDKLAGRVVSTTEVVQGDVLDAATLGAALDGVTTAYYLVHSLAGGGAFADDDRAAAQFFAVAARDAGVERLVYLGGLGGGDGLSDHLASRQEVGRILRESGVPTIEFRTSIVVGAGSASFELIRSIVDTLPAIVVPDWLENASQPIAVDDAVEYLAAALDVPLAGSAIYEIGGADRVSYLELMREYARARGLRRLMTTVPATSALPTELLARVAPERARVALNLLDGLRNETIVRDDAARRAFSHIEPLGYREAVVRALAA